MLSDTPELKRKRVTRACDKCHREANRCSPGSNPQTCARCEASGVPCTSDRPSKRRGPPHRGQGSLPGTQEKRGPMDRPFQHSPLKERANLQMDNPARQQASSTQRRPDINGAHRSGEPHRRPPASATEESTVSPDPRQSSTAAVNTQASIVPPLHDLNGVLPLSLLDQVQQAPSHLAQPGTSSVHSASLQGLDDIADGALHQSLNVDQNLDFGHGLMLDTSNWIYEDVLAHDTIESMLDSFYKTAYPLRPYFHWPTFQRQVSNLLYRVDRGLYAVTMAVCALAAARLPDGTQVNSSASPCQPSTSIVQTCLGAAIRAFPADIDQISDYQFLKAKAILSAMSVQIGDLRKALHHLGDYSTISNNIGFHHESNWPDDLKETERQERRRLFWYMYQHDTYMSTTFGAIMRHREARSTVQYPDEVWDDEDITDTMSIIRPGTVSFLRGWNYCSDLYRILEHVAGNERPKHVNSRSMNNTNTVLSLLDGEGASPISLAKCQAFVEQQFEALPAVFKSPSAMKGSPAEDRFGFIASNVLITTHTVKMYLVGRSSRSVHQRCAIAGELLDDLSSLPASYINASGITTLHHLAGIGHLLSNCIRPPMTAWSYLQIRNLLLVLADYLATIEVTRVAATGVSKKLKNHIAEIDQFISQMAQDHTGTSMTSGPPIGQGILSRWATMNPNGQAGDEVMLSPSFHSAVNSHGAGANTNRSPASNIDLNFMLNGNQTDLSGTVGGQTAMFGSIGNPDSGKAPTLASTSSAVDATLAGSESRNANNSFAEAMNNFELPNPRPNDTLPLGNNFDIWANFPQLDILSLLVANSPKTSTSRDP